MFLDSAVWLNAASGTRPEPVRNTHTLAMKMAWNGVTVGFIVAFLPIDASPIGVKT
jgi:hypothetical protein